MDFSMNDGDIWLSTAFAHVRDGVIGVDRWGGIVCMNPAAERLTGWQEIHAKGRSADSIFNFPEEASGNSLEDSIQEAIGSGAEVKELQRELLSAGNRPVRVDLTFTPVFQSGECRGAVIIFSGQEPGGGPDTRPGVSEKTMDMPGQVETRRVLVMDDDEMVRNLTVQKLIRLGYESEGASNGEEAILKFKSAKDSKKPFDVVVLDLIVRGGMGGRDTLQMLMEIDPAVKAILTSGHAVDPVLTNFWEYGFFGVIRKPFVIKELDVTIRQALAEDWHPAESI